MNGKRAKSLRRLAQRLYPKAPAVSYAPKTPVLIPATDFFNRGKSAVFTGVARLVNGCQRALYQDIKRAHIAGVRS